ncbi:MAG TPA: membrane protein insertase YidC [Verrucomicrobiae bacterium]
MDRKTIILLAVCLGLFLLWPRLIDRIYPPSKKPFSTNTVAGATNAVVAPGTNLSTAQFSAATNQPAPVKPAEFTVPAGVTDKTLVLETGDARYTFTTLGGGLKQIELSRYRETVGRAVNASGDTNKFATLNLRAPAPVLALLGGDALQGDNVFELTKTGANSVQARKALTNGLVLLKDFRITSNYMVEATATLTNRSEGTLGLPAQQWVVGTSTPMGPHDDGTYQGASWSDGEKVQKVDQKWFDNKSLFSANNPRSEYSGGNTNVAWAAVHNQFFVVAVVAKEKAAQMVARPLNFPPPTREELAADPKASLRPYGHQAVLVYPEAALAPRQAVTREFQIYAGPKEYQTLAKIGVQLGNNIEELMEYGWPFGFVARFLLISMNGLHGLGLNYGLAIIAITIIIKVLFWPLTRASTRSMKRMSELAPQVKALQQKYKDDPAKAQKKMWELYKENKVSPLGGCLPMLLQLPVFFGFYQMIRSAIELRGSHFLWVNDLTQPDTIFVLHALGSSFPINPLPLLYGSTTLWQAHLTPVQPGADPLQAKMMKYMPLIFLFILYNFSSGLTLYWTVQNLLTIAQMKLTKAKDAPPSTAAKAPVAAVHSKKK